MLIDITYLFPVAAVAFLIGVLMGRKAGRRSMILQMMHSLPRVPRSPVPPAPPRTCLCGPPYFPGHGETDRCVNCRRIFPPEAR